MIKTTLPFRLIFFIFGFLFFSYNPLEAQSTFSDFPWLDDVVNMEDCCQNQKVTAYQLGIFTFIYIEKRLECADARGELYFQDGTFYCIDINDMDCRAAYGLTEDNAIILFECSNEIEVDSTITICVGESVYLPAITALTPPPVGPSGPDIPTFPPPCNPTLHAIELEEIMPSAESLSLFEMDSVGFTVFPTTSGIYKVTSIGSCFEVIGTDQSGDEFFEESIIYEVIVEEECPLNCAALDAFDLGANPCESCLSEVSIYSYQGADYLVRIEDNPLCSDGLTTVMNCDSSNIFCFAGGIAGFNQCEDFFREAILVERVWSRLKDCDGSVKEVEPCTDIKGIDFGLCEAIMGVAIVDGKCTTISGCLDFIIKGVDYSNAFFPTVEICQQTCDVGNNNNAEIFSNFPWLTDIIDPNDCGGTSIEVYDLGAFSFIHIQTAESGELFFEDGTFYCMDFPNYNCRDLYGLGVEKITDSWQCEITKPSELARPIGDDLLNNNKSQQLLTLKAFPNPTTGLVQIQIDAEKEESQQIVIYDMYGRLVERLKVSTPTFSIDLSAEQAGVYLVEWYNGDLKEVVKVVKQ